MRVQRTLAARSLSLRVTLPLLSLSLRPSPVRHAGLSEWAVPSQTFLWLWRAQVPLCAPQSDVGTPESQGKACSGPGGTVGSAREKTLLQRSSGRPPTPCSGKAPRPGCLSCRRLIETVKIQPVPGDGGARRGQWSFDAAAKPGAGGRPRLLWGPSRPTSGPPLGQRLRPATNTPGGSGDSQKPAMGCCLFVFS